MSLLLLFSLPSPSEPRSSSVSVSLQVQADRQTVMHPAMICPDGCLPAYIYLDYLILHAGWLVAGGTDGWTDGWMASVGDISDIDRRNTGNEGLGGGQERKKKSHRHL